MSIATEISRIKDAKDAIRASIIAKGVNVPQAAKLDTYADRIDEIVQTASGNMEVVTSSPSGTINAADNKFYMLSADAGALVFNLPAMQQGGHGIYLLMTTASTSVVSFTSTGSVPINFPTGFQVEADKCYLMDFEFAQSAWQVSVEEWFVNGGGGEANKYITAYTQTESEIEALDKNNFKIDTPTFSIRIPDGTVALTKNAFAVTNITSVYIPKTVIRFVGVNETISDIETFGSFRGCSRLTSVKFENSNEPLPSNARLISVFRNCTSLTSVTLPDNYTSLDRYFFSDCTSLQNVSAPNLINISGNVFLNCTNLSPSCDFFDNWLYVGTCAFQGCSKITHVKVNGFLGSNNQQTYDGSPTGWYGAASVFKNCSSLTSVEFSDLIIGIPSGLFAGCTSLEHVTLPPNLQTTSGETFDGCTSLKSIEFPDTVTNMTAMSTSSQTNNMFRNCSSLEYIKFPSSKPYLGYESTFQGCSSLKNIDYVADWSLTIGNNVFKDCTSLETLRFGGRFIGAGTYSWYSVISNCPSLKTVEFPYVRSIQGCVTNCASLESFRLGPNVTSIKNYTINSSLPSLTSFICEAVTPPTLTTSAINSTVAQNLTIYVPAESVDAYKTATNWSTYASKIQPIPES